MSFTVYRSSAGSGKTYTLVREYLKIILQDTDSFRNILAVTFTNKAAGEMKRRVLECLEELSGPMAGQGKASLTLLPSLVEDTGLPEEEIRKRSAEALKKILHNYSDFAIGTIDSFSHRIIRAFAHDFGLPMNFTVETDADELLETAVDLLLDQAGDDEKLTVLLVNFLENNLEDDKSLAIDKALMEFSKLLLDEESHIHLHKIRNLGIDDFRSIAGFLRKSTREFEKTARDEAGIAWQAILDSGLDQKAFAGRYGIPWYFEQLADGRLDNLLSANRLADLFGNGKLSSAKASSADKEKIEQIRPILEMQFRKIQEQLVKSHPLYSLHKILGKTIYPLAVLKNIDRILQEFKKQNNIIHISEFNSRISKIVAGEPVPFIYERLGEKYRHILIDEFQDTSALQWQNFVPLIENSLASGYFNLVVGDGKQAIYRWRNGDVEQFAELPALKGSRQNRVLRDREEALVRNFTEKLLDRNYRSGQEIVNFNNDFFRFLSGYLDEPRKKIYEGLEQSANENKAGGYINIYFTAKHEKEEDEEDKAADDVVLQRIASDINTCCSDGYAYRDIAILCRANKEASLIARFLIEKGIPVVSGESLLLNFSPLVRMLTGLVRYVFGPVNPVIQNEILYNYSELIPQMKQHYHDWLNKQSDPVNRTKLFDGFLSDRLGVDGVAALKTLPVYDLFIRLTNSFFPSSSADPYVQFFLNAALKFSSGKSSSVPDFIEWWDKNGQKQSVVVPSGSDAVQVMTIHKAKGLQFPVVIYPYAGGSLKNTRAYIWADLEHDEVPGLPAAIMRSTKDVNQTDFADKFTEERQKSILDLLNLLYVVMTRPEQRLYIIPPLPAKKTGDTPSVPNFIKSWLQHKDLWEDDRFEYEFGSRGTVIPVIREQVNVLPLPGLRFSEWRDRIRIRSRAPEMWNLDDPDRNRRFGNVLHTILAGITAEKSAEAMLMGMIGSGLLERSREEEVRGKLNKILNDPEFAFIFDEQAEVRPEAEILTSGGHAIRPDRVIIRGRQAIVVDYKTGRPMEKYKNQLTVYSDYLREMGYTDVKKYLLYLEPEVRLEEVV